MPIVGNLSEFPLPEVLLLIGSRTGCLRLYGSDEFTDVEIDLSDGSAHFLRIGQNLVSGREQIVAELSFIIETGEGMFEFYAQSIIPPNSEEALPTNELVMSLVLKVDEKLARRQAVLAPELFYILTTPAPDVLLDSGMRLFFHQSHHLLAGGVRAEDLAEYLGLSNDTVKLNLYNLHEAGLLKLVETTDVATLRKTMLSEEITQKNNDYQLAAEASELIRRSGKLLKLNR